MPDLVQAIAGAIQAIAALVAILFAYWTIISYKESARYSLRVAAGRDLISAAVETQRVLFRARRSQRVVFIKLPEALLSRVTDENRDAVELYYQAHFILTEEIETIIRLRESLVDSEIVFGSEVRVHIEQLSAAWDKLTDASHMLSEMAAGIRIMTIEEVNYNLSIILMSHNDEFSMSVDYSVELILQICSSTIREMRKR